MQNAKALAEAKTALETGEIKTPSVCSYWTTESAGGEEGSVDAKSAKKHSSASSSGDLYRGSNSRSTNSEYSRSSKDKVLRDSDETEEEEECTCTEDTTESEGEWEPADSSTSEHSSSTKNGLEVRSRCCIESFLSAHVILGYIYVKIEG